MKAVFRISGSVFLLLLFLVSTLGVSFSKLECMMSGQVEFSIDASEACCPPEVSETPTFRPHCCHLEQYSIELDEQISNADDFQWIEVFAETPLLPEFAIASGFDPFTDLWHFTDPSPPDGGPSLILRKQSFLI